MEDIFVGSFDFVITRASFHFVLASRRYLYGDSALCPPSHLAEAMLLNLANDSLLMGLKVFVFFQFVLINDLLAKFLEISFLHATLKKRLDILHLFTFL